MGGEEKEVNFFLMAKLFNSARCYLCNCSVELKHKGQNFPAIYKNSAALVTLFGISFKRGNFHQFGSYYKVSSILKSDWLSPYKAKLLTCQISSWSQRSTTTNKRGFTGVLPHRDPGSFKRIVLQTSNLLL